MRKKIYILGHLGGLGLDNHRFYSLCGLNSIVLKRTCVQRWTSLTRCVHASAAKLSVQLFNSVVNKFSQT